MNQSFDLLKIEKRTYQTTYQDGLWDIYYGVLMISMAIFLDRPESDYGWLNLLWMVLAFALAYLLFRAGKKWITDPRLGTVSFGEIRKKKTRSMTILLGILVILQAVMLFLSFFAWLNPEFGKYLSNRFHASNELLLVSTIAFLMVCTGMSIKSYFTDFIRGYYIAFLMGAAVFLIIYTDKSIYPLILGILVLLPGIFLLARFLKHHPLPAEPQEGK